MACEHTQGRSCNAQAVYLDLVVVCGTPVLQAVLKEEEHWRVSMHKEEEC